MRLAFNSNTQTFINQITALNSKQVQLQRQLSSGQRVQDAGQDPAALGRAFNSVSEKTRIQFLERNLNRAELVGNYTLETLERFKVIADTAALTANTTDGLTSSADFRARGLQINQLIEQSMRVLNTQISGNYLFAGANVGQEPFQAARYEQFLQDAGGNFIDLNGNPTASPIPSVYVDPNDDSIAFNVLQTPAGIPFSDTAFFDTSLPFSGAPGDPTAGRDADTGDLVFWDGNDWMALRDRNGNVVGLPQAGATDPDASGTGFLTEARTVNRELFGMVRSVQYTGTTAAEDDVSFRVGESATISPFSRGAANAEYLSFVNDLIQLRDAYFQEDLSKIESLIPSFDQSQEMVSLGLVEFGSILKGLEVTTRINESRFNELEKLTAREIDIDPAETILQLNRAQMAYEAALSSGARILSMSLLDYLR